MSFADDDPPLESANAFTIAPQFKLIETQQDTQPDTIAADTSVINEGSNAQPLGEAKPWLNPEAEAQQWNFAGKRVGRRSTMTAEEKKRDNKLRKQQRKAAVKKAAENAAQASVTSDIAGVNAIEDPNQSIKTGPHVPTTSKLPENAKQAARQKDQERRKRRRAEANKTMAPQHAQQGYRQGAHERSFVRPGGLQGQSTKQAQQSRPGRKRGPVTPDRRYGNTNFPPQTSGQYDNVYAGYGPSSHKRQPPHGYYDSYGEGYPGGHNNGQGYGQNQNYEGYQGYYEGYSKGHQEGCSGEYFNNDHAFHNQYGDYYGGQYDDYYRQFGGPDGGHYGAQDYGNAPYQQRPQNAPMVPPVDRGDEMITMRKSELAALIQKERAKEREQLRKASAANGDQSMALRRRQETRDAATDMLYEMLQEAGVQIPELRKREQGKKLPPGDHRDAVAILIELLRSRRDQQHAPPPTTSQAHENQTGTVGTTFETAKPAPAMEKTPVGVDGDSCSRSVTPPRPASTSANGFLFSSTSNRQIAPQRSLSVPPNV